MAGPYHLIRDEHDGIPLGLSCRTSLAPHLDADADELFTMTRQCLDEFHRLFGIRYPFGDYHQAFVPEFNAGAMENPGCVTIRDLYVFDTRVTRGKRLLRATLMAHEMAHQWFGNITTPCGGTTSGSTSRSRSTSATASPPTSRSTTTRGPTWPGPVARGD